MEKSPADHIVYKGRAAIQFSLKPGKATPIKTKRGEYTGTSVGCLFVVGANLLEDGKYDWNNKVTIGLSHHELGKLMQGLKGQKQTFYHDPNKGGADEGKIAKVLNISPAASGDKIFFNLSQVIEGKETKIHGVPFDKDEALTLYTLLSGAIPRVLGWT